jgi:SAM-dependent methyltransferase
MRRDWDRRAAENARLYIADKESEGLNFSLSGCRDAFAILEDLHPWLRADMRMLEIGCGIGRMLQFFAVLFAEVHGVDVSPVMIESARTFLARFDNVHVRAGDGRGLAAYPDAHFDLIVSHAVFQHVPEKAVIRDYVEDAHRALRPGGLFKFLVKTAPWGGEHLDPTWCGVDIERADVEAWVQAFGYELVNAYSAHEPTTAWVILRKPAS